MSRARTAFFRYGLTLESQLTQPRAKNPAPRKEQPCGNPVRTGR